MKDGNYWTDKYWPLVLGRLLSRRTFLAGAGLVALGGLVRCSSAPSSPPSDRLPLLEPEKFPSSQMVWSWEQRLSSLSPPFTGSPHHTAYVDWLDRELQAARLETQRRSFTFSYWEPQSYGLWDPDGQRIPTTGYQPYSGETSASGITAPLHYAGTAPNLDYVGAAGKIVVYEAPLPPVPSGSLYTPFGYYPPDSGAEVPAVEVNPQWAFITAPSLAPAKAAGAVGVIRVWTNISDEAAMHQDQPWHSPPAGIPALWVGRSAGEQLKALADANQTITLKLHATVTPDRPTDNLWAVLPGQTDEAIIINSHSDGCNSLEENGGLGVLALAKYFSQIPLSQRLRTLVFLITTGHFSHGMVAGTSTWQAENPELMRRAVACVTLEHLGGMEWGDDEEGRYRPTGKVAFQPMLTGLQSMADVFLQSAEAVKADRMEALNVTGAPYFGEGSSFWQAGIPTISFIGGTWYTFTAPPLGELVKLDPDRLYVEIGTAALCVQRLNGMSIEEIRGTQGA
jgi:hypothetical protein